MHKYPKLSLFLFCIVLLNIFLISHILSATVPKKQITVSSKIQTLIKNGNAAGAWTYLQTLPHNPHAHDYAHTIGSAMFKQHGIKGIGICTPQFAFGCMHGFTQTYITDHGIQDAGKLAKACNEILKKNEDSCPHGIGHGILAYYGYVVPIALSACDTIFSDTERTYCYNGVFMENATAKTSVRTEHGATQQTTNPYAFCQNIAKHYLPACYENSVTFVMHLFKNDLARTATYCFSLEKTYTSGCIRQLSQKIALQTKHPSDIPHQCKQMTKAYMSDCIITAAQEYVFQNTFSVAEIQKSICDTLAPESGRQCSARVSEQASRNT